MKTLAVAVAVTASFAAIQAQEVYKVGNGVSAPVVIRQVNPEYTPEALAARIEGVVGMEMIVHADGTADDVEWQAIRSDLEREVRSWSEALGSPRDVPPVALTGMVSSIVHLAYHLGAIRQIGKSARGPREGTFVQSSGT